MAGPLRQQLGDGQPQDQTIHDDLSAFGGWEIKKVPLAFPLHDEFADMEVHYHPSHFFGLCCIRFHQTFKTMRSATLQSVEAL
jgi:hypothetical protein